MPPGKPQRVNWAVVDKMVMEKSEGRITPEMIGEMTLPEIFAFLQDPRQLGPGGRNMTTAEIERRLLKHKTAGPLERLRRYRG